MYYRLDIRLKTHKELMQLLEKPDLVIADSIYIKKLVIKGNTYFLYFDQYNEFLYLIRDDSGEFLDKVKMIVDQIVSVVKEEYGFTNGVNMYDGFSTLNIYSKDVMLSKISDKPVSKWKVLEKGSIRLPLTENTYSSGVKEIEVHSNQINGLIFDRVFSQLVNLNDKLPF